MIQHVNKEDLGRRRRRSASTAPKTGTAVNTGTAVKKETFATVINGYTRNTELKRAIWNFVSHRRDIGIPLSLKLLKITLRKLSEVSCNEHDAIERIEKATRKRYFVDDPIKSADDVIFVVDRDWAITNIQPVIDFANSQGYHVEQRSPYLM